MYHHRFSLTMASGPSQTSMQLRCKVYQLKNSLLSFDFKGHQARGNTTLLIKEKLQEISRSERI